MPNKRVQRTSLRSPLTRKAFGAKSALTVNRRLRGFVIRAVLAMSVLAVAGLQAAQPIEVASECSGLLPLTLLKQLQPLYPGSNVLNLDQLESRDRTLFTKAEGRRCPGVVRLDFFGNGQETYGIVLVSGSGESRRARVLLATRKNGASPWRIENLEVMDDPGLPTISKDKPGAHEDVYGAKSVNARGESLVLVGWESWAILYAWTGQKVDKVWLAD